MAVELFIHKMSEHMDTARIVQWLVKEGETVRQFQILMEVETDKAVAELESPAAGIIKGIRPGAVDGAEVKVGEVIAYIAASDEPVPTLPPLGANEVNEKNPSPFSTGGGQAETQLPSTSEDGLGERPEFPSPEGRGTRGEGEGQGLRATPVARRVAKELGVDLSQVKGTGPDGRVKEEDVRAYAESSRNLAQQPADSLSPIRTTQTSSIELTHNQRLTGQRMLESVQTAPQFSLTLSADMTQALRLQEAAAAQAGSGQRPSVTAILVKAAADALKHHPRVNAAFVNNRIVAYSEIHVGVALASGGELVAPVIRNADRLSLEQVSRQIKAFQEKGQHMRFTLEDLTGGTFTISNLGMYGIERFNAILIPGQSAILAAGKIIKMPVALDDSTLAFRPIIYLTLTVDHRVLDGVQAAQFLSELKRLLETPSSMS